MKWIYISSAFLFLCSYHIRQNVHAQLPGLYLDAGGKTDFFFARELENIRQGQSGLTYRLGIGFWKSDNEEYVLSAEFAWASRTLTRQYEDDRRYSLVFAAPSVFVTASRLLNDHWRLEGGLGFSALTADNSSLLLSFPLLPADDFREWDVLLAAGAEYKFSRIVSLVARAEWGFVPMLKYQPIGDLGELLDPYNDLFYRSLQLAIRFNIRQK